MLGGPSTGGQDPRRIALLGVQPKLVATHPDLAAELVGVWQVRSREGGEEKG